MNDNQPDRAKGKTMTKFTVEVTQTVEIEVDETKFDAQFLKEFEESFYPFSTLTEHAEHLGQLACRGLVDKYSEFIEGYGPPNELGIKIGDPFSNVIEMNSKLNCT